MNIGFIYNTRHVTPDINNPQYIKEAEFDEPITIQGITAALETLGHKVFHVEADEEAYIKLKNLKGTIDLVFNIAEGMHGADREAQIPAMLEMLQIPYTGPKPLVYAAGLNKSVAKEILGFHSVRVPKWQTIHEINELDKKNIDFFPVIAKPLGEGSSKGIRSCNLVNDQESLRKIVFDLLQELVQPVLVEEYLPGREFTVAVIGTPPKVLPIIEVTFDDLPEDMPKFEHYESKWIYDEPAKGKDPLVCPARIDRELENKINALCLSAFDILQMKDWARFDIRLGSDGEPYFIEVNCPPGISPHIEGNSRFFRASKSGGLTYEKMIEEILKSACIRYGIQY